MNYIHPMCRRPPSITFFNYMRTNLQSDLNSFQNLRIGHCRIVWRGFPSLELWPQVVFSIHFRLSFKKRNSSRTHWVVHIDSWISSTLKFMFVIKHKTWLQVEGGVPSDTLTEQPSVSQKYENKQ